MIEVYGKPNCSQCEFIKNELDKLGVKYNYTEDEELLINKAKELNVNNNLKERKAPLIIHQDKTQILHKDIKFLQ